MVGNGISEPSTTYVKKDRSSVFRWFFLSTWSYFESQFGFERETERLMGPVRTDVPLGLLGSKVIGSVGYNPNISHL